MSSRAKKKIKRPQKPLDQLTADARRVCRHGITPADLEQAEHRMFSKGFEEGKTFVLRDCYAAAALAYKDMTGANVDNVTEFLRKLDDYVTYSLQTEDLINKALDEAGVELNFREAFSEERISTKT